MGTESQASVEMPKWKCHKEVWALKIKEVQYSDDAKTATLVFEDSNFAPIEVGMDYVPRCKPTAGGYYVVYKDGYKSFSPADAFEDGYTLIED